MITETIEFVKFIKLVAEGRVHHIRHKAAGRAGSSAFIGRDVSQYGDSVVYGAMDLDFDVQNRFLVESSNDRVPPRARTLGSVTLNSSSSDPLEMTNGEVIVDELAGTFRVNGADSITPSAIREDSSGSFLELGWSQNGK